MQISPAPCCFLPRLNTLFSNILSLSPSTDVRGQVSHP
jgi:hypothetical protein